jgi:hypothetical protein
MSDARSEGRLERAIDGAVREMLDVEPRADLTARVVAQLSASGSRLPALGFRLPASGWLLGSVAAAAVVLLAVFVARRSEPVAPQAPVVVAQRSDVRLPAPLTTPSSAPSVASAQPRVTTDAVARPRRIAAAAVPDDSTTAVAIDPLQSIAPISVAPIEQKGIAPADVAVRPLNSISEIQVAPLTPPDRR